MLAPGYAKEKPESASSRGGGESSGLPEERTRLDAEIDSENESSIREIVKSFGWVLPAQLTLQTLQPQGVVVRMEKALNLWGKT